MIKTHVLRAATMLAVAASTWQPVQAQDRTEITLARFFGACEADFGKSVDVRAARGECGVITTLVNISTPIIVFYEVRLISSRAHDRRVLLFRDFVVYVRLFRLSKGQLSRFLRGLTSRPCTYLPLL